MGKKEFDEVITAAKEMEAAKHAQIARKGPSMADHISHTGTRVLDADLNRIQETAMSTARARLAKAGGPIAAIVGGNIPEAGGSVGAGSSAGLRNEKSAYVGLNNTGYDNPAQMVPNQPATKAATMTDNYVNMASQTATRNVTDYRKATTTGARLLASRFT
jgi:hypothetical protein